MKKNDSWDLFLSQSQFVLILKKEKKDIEKVDNMKFGIFGVLQVSDQS